MKPKLNVKGILIYLVLVAGLLCVALPIIVVLLTSLKEASQLTESALTLPKSWLWKNYVDAWAQARFDRYFLNSFIVTSIVVVLTCFLSILNGYAFGSYTFPFKRLLYSLFLIGIIVPMEAFIIPLYYQIRDLGLLNTHFALILPQVGLNLCFGTLLMTGFFSNLPRDLYDAAKMDGAGSWLTLWKILVPNVIPGIITMFVVVAVWSWNEFLLALVLVSDETLRTLPLGLVFFKSRFAMNIPLSSAAVIISALPIVVLYVLFNREFIRGVTGGTSSGH